MEIETFRTPSELAIDYMVKREEWVNIYIHEDISGNEPILYWIANEIDKCACLQALFEDIRYKRNKE